MNKSVNQYYKLINLYIEPGYVSQKHHKAKYTDAKSEWENLSPHVNFQNV